MSKWCVDCYHMDENMNRHGKFRCTNARKSNYDEVFPEQLCCDSFGDAWNSRRPTGFRDDLVKESKRKRCYLITAITKICNYEEENIYKESFYYLEALLKNTNNYDEFINMYDTEGPALADQLVEENNVDYCNYLTEVYLDSFVNILQKDTIGEENNVKANTALVIFISMFNEVKKHFKKNRVLKLQKK